MRKGDQTARKRSHEEFTADLDRMRELAKALQGDLGEEREKQKKIPPGKGSFETTTQEGIKGRTTTPEGAKERNVTYAPSDAVKAPDDMLEPVESSSEEEKRVQKGLPLRQSTQAPASKINYASKKGKEHTRSEFQVLGGGQLERERTSSA